MLSFDGAFRFHFDAKVKWSLNASDQKAYYSTSPQNFREMKIFVPLFFLSKLSVQLCYFCN